MHGNDLREQCTIFEHELMFHVRIIKQFFYNRRTEYYFITKKNILSSTITCRKKFFIFSFWACKMAFFRTIMFAPEKHACATSTERLWTQVDHFDERKRPYTIVHDDVSGRNRQTYDRLRTVNHPFGMGHITVVIRRVAYGEKRT